MMANAGLTTVISWPMLPRCGPTSARLWTQRGPDLAAAKADGPNPRRIKRKHDGNPGNGPGPRPQGSKPASGQGQSKKHRQAVKRNGLPKAKRELTDAHRQKLLKEGKCLNCEETGHFARECPNPAKEVKQGF